MVPAFRMNTALSNSVICDGAFYGHGLDASFCLEAYNSIPRDDTEHSYGQPTHGEFDYRIPQRYSSCEGLFLYGEKRNAF